MPNWIGHSKNSPEYRFITRERLIEQPLPGMEGQMELPFPAMELSNRGWYKVFGVVTNRSIAADELIWWSRQRCGKGEEVHSVLKSDLAGGRLPSGLFGANAAWWAISPFNLNSAMKRQVLGGQWVGKRLKAVRFALIALPGRVMRHARRLIIRLARGHPSYELLLGRGSAGCRAVSSIGRPCLEHRFVGDSAELAGPVQAGHPDVHAFFAPAEGFSSHNWPSEPLPIPSTGW